MWETPVLQDWNLPQNNASDDDHTYVFIVTRVNKQHALKPSQDEVKHYEQQRNNTQPDSRMNVRLPSAYASQTITQDTQRSSEWASCVKTCEASRSASSPLRVKMGGSKNTPGRPLGCCVQGVIKSLHGNACVLTSPHEWPLARAESQPKLSSGLAVDED